MKNSNIHNNDGGIVRTRRQSLSIYLALDAIIDLGSDRKINMTYHLQINQLNQGVSYFNKKHYDLGKKCVKCYRVSKET